MPTYTFKYPKKGIFYGKKPILSLNIIICTWKVVVLSCKVIYHSILWSLIRSNHHPNVLGRTVRGNVQKKKQYICWHFPNWSGPPSLLPYFWQIYFWHIVDHVDLPPSPRIFDKNHKILGFKTLMFFWTLPLTFSIIPITFWGSGVQTERHRFPVDVIAD